MVLTGEMITAQEGEKSGLVSKIFPPEKLVAEAVKLGEKISAQSPLTVALAKEAVNVCNFCRFLLNQNVKFNFYDFDLNCQFFG